MAKFFIPLISLCLMTGLQAKATNQMSDLAEFEAKAINQMSELAELHRNLTNQTSFGRIANQPGSGSRVCCR